MDPSNRVVTKQTLSSCLCSSGRCYARETVLVSILGNRMMQGEVTIESFPSYPCQGPSTATDILLALPLFDLLAVSEAFVKVAIG